MTTDRTAIVRFSVRTFDRLVNHICMRYPDEEAGTFATFGWRHTPRGLVLCLADLLLPKEGDIDEKVGIVRINEPYTLRVALQAEEYELAVGVVHSHPQGYVARPSSVDDDMDSYYAEYFSGFAPDRPYVSLIFTREEDGVIKGSGRVWWNNHWYRVEQFFHPSQHIEVVTEGWNVEHDRAWDTSRVARLASLYGEEAVERLRKSRVVVIGASGTGSPVLEILARAGVGNITVVDPDSFEPSNLERIHGSGAEDCQDRLLKVEIAKRHIEYIDPDINVTTITGRVPQPEVVNAMVHADLVIGCTDSGFARLAMSEVANRYNIRAIDCGVSIDGKETIDSQLLRIILYGPDDPCYICHGFYDPARIANELMSDNEKSIRMEQAERAIAGGHDPNQYWTHVPLLHTVGHVTTTIASMVAGYSIGILTGRFAPPFNFLELDLLKLNQIKHGLETMSECYEKATSCTCIETIGHGDQDQISRIAFAPFHWPNATINVSVEQ